MKLIRLTPALVSSLACLLASVLFAAGPLALSESKAPLAEPETGSPATVLAFDLSGKTITPFAEANAKALRDPRHSLVRLAGARVMSEAPVFLQGGQLVYDGRIDNRYVAPGKERPEATQHELREVLEAVVQGKLSPYVSAFAVGCYAADAK